MVSLLAAFCAASMAFLRAAGIALLESALPAEALLAAAALAAAAAAEALEDFGLSLDSAIGFWVELPACFLTASFLALSLASRSCCSRSIRANLNSWRCLANSTAFSSALISLISDLALR